MTGSPDQRAPVPTPEQEKKVMLLLDKADKWLRVQNPDTAVATWAMMILCAHLLSQSEGSIDNLVAQFRNYLEQARTVNHKGTMQ